MSRLIDLPIPRGMYLKHGRYYRVAVIDGKQKWIALSKDLEESIKLFELSRSGASIERPLRTQSRLDEGEYRAEVIAYLPRVLNNIRRSALARGLPLELDLAALEELARVSNYRCAITHLKFSGMGLDGVRQRPYVPSCDRIDCNLGYTKSNTRLVLASVNVALNQWGEAVLSTIAHAYVKKARRRLLDSPQTEGLDALQSV